MIKIVVDSLNVREGNFLVSHWKSAPPPGKIVREVVNARKVLQDSAPQRACARLNAARVEQMEPLSYSEETDERYVEFERSSWRPLVGNAEIKVAWVS
jgi:hypothetical protein